MPRPLAALLAIALVEGLVWCIALPPLQGPDEIGHFAYVQAIAETGSIPWHTKEPDVPGQPYSTEVEIAELCSGLSGLAQNLSARAPASVLDERACFADLNHLPRGSSGNGGFTSAEKNPPLYYLYESLPYLAFSHSTFFTRSLMMRLANLPAMLAVVLFTWLLAGELLLGLPRGRALRALATAAVALNPQLTMLAATINPDLSLAALWTAGLWLSVTVIRRGATRTRACWLIAVCVAASLTQGRGLPLIPVAAFALGAAWWRRRRPSGLLAAAGVGLAALVALIGGYALLRYAVNDDITASRARAFASYIWQFYLPKLGFMQPTLHPGYGVRQVFVERFLGTFAQLELTFSPATLNFLTTAAEVTALSALVGLAVRRRELLRARWLVALLTLAAVSCMLMLHAAAYSSLLHLPADPVITGRYLLPLLSLYGVGIALALSWPPRVLAAVLSGALVVGLAVLQLGALSIVLERFYA